MKYEGVTGEGSRYRVPRGSDGTSRTLWVEMSVPQIQDGTRDSESYT